MNKLTRFVIVEKYNDNFIFTSTKKGLEHCRRFIEGSNLKDEVNRRFHENFFRDGVVTMIGITNQMWKELKEKSNERKR
jgi:hypothetical protein